MDPTLALQALAAIIADEGLRNRFIALTGYDADMIRARAGSADMAAAVAAFLSGHEPDLLKVAGEIGVAPEQLAKERG